MFLLLFLALISVAKLGLEIYLKNNQSSVQKFRGISIIISILYYSISAYIIIKYAPMFWNVFKTFRSILWN